VCVECFLSWSFFRLNEGVSIIANVSVCGARYKTRPGLTYHYSHSHKEKPAVNLPADEEGNVECGLLSTPGSPQQCQQFDQQTTTGWSEFHVTFLNAPGKH